jgi:hypothetical protein
VPIAHRKLELPAERGARRRLPAVGSREIAVQKPVERLGDAIAFGESVPAALLGKEIVLEPRIGRRLGVAPRVGRARETVADLAKVLLLRALIDANERRSYRRAARTFCTEPVVAGAATGARSCAPGPGAGRRASTGVNEPVSG